MVIKSKLDKTYSFDELIDRFLVSFDMNQTWRGGHLLEFNLGDEELVKSVYEMLVKFDLSEEKARELSQDLTVYNPTAPFEFGGLKYLLGRVEPRNANYSVVALFQESPGSEGRKWEVVKEAEMFKCSEDPFYCGVIEGYGYFGMVRIEKIAKEGETPPHRTVIHRFKVEESDNFVEQFTKFEQFAEGPYSMKGIRFVAMPSGEIALFKRPKDGIFEAGKIAFKTIQSIDQLPADLAGPVLGNEAIKNLFKGDEWGGSNQVFVLKNGLIGVLGHIARVGKYDKKDYAAASIIVDPKSKTALEIKVIATAYSFSEIVPKTFGQHINLHEIMYSGGLIRQSDGKAMLYAGLGDTVAGCIEIPDPFLEWENQS